MTKPKKLPPLHQKLMVTYLIITALILLIAFTTLNLTLRAFILKQSLGEIEGTFETIRLVLKDKLAESTGAPQNPQEVLRPTLEALNTSLRVARQTDGTEIFVYSGTKRIFPRDLQKSSLSANAISQLESKFGDISLDETEQIKLDNHRYLVSHQIMPRPNKPSAKLHLLLIASLEDNDALITRTNRLILGLFLATILAAFFMLRRLSNQLARPFEVAARHAQEIGSGSRVEILEKPTTAETEALYQSLNAMSKSIARAQQDQTDYFQNLSHDLRTPLMSIQGYAEGIQSGVFSDPVGPAKIIAQESVKLKNLVDQLLTLSRLSEGRQGLKGDMGPHETLLVGERLDQYVTRAKHALNKPQIAISINCPKQLTITTDEMLFEAIFSNLISNALRYATQMVVLDVREFSNMGASFMLVTVKDDGPGIEDAVMTHLFERFNKGATGKIGLGLAIVHSATTLLEGKITAKNNQGAQFTVTLPICL